MTRENKLGLLVGLAFIIVVGILISDHLSSTNEAPSAPLKVAGDTLRSGLGEPGNDDVAPVLRAPSSVAPSQPLVINAELNRRNAQPPVRFVQPSSGNAITPIAPLTNTNPPLTIAERLRQAAEQQGEPLVAVTNPNGNNPSTGTNTPVTPPVTPPHADASAAPRSYEAQPGDSLALIAKKMYGSSSKANRKAIIAANADLQDDPDLIVAGQTYVIPPIGPAVAVNNTKPAPAPAPAPVTPAPAEKTVVYVVQPHDTLWSIAVNEVGNASAVSAIRELNSTVLNGSDRVKPNMKLKLPAKTAG